GALGGGLDREPDDHRSLRGLARRFDVISGQAEHLDHRVVLTEPNPAKEVPTARRPVDARANPRQDRHRPGWLDRRGLDRLPDTQPLRIDPVVLLDLLIAAVHPDPKLGPRTVVHEVRDPRRRSTDP